MSLFKPLRGSRTTLEAQPLHDGYAYFCTDDGSFHIDFTDIDGNLTRKQISAKDCETLAGMSLDSILNSINSTVGKVSTISLPTTGWVEATNVYSQVVTVAGVTANSKVDLYPTPEQLVELQAMGIALVAVNEDGVVTVYALNNKPTSDYNMQVTLTEVNEGV